MQTKNVIFSIVIVFNLLYACKPNDKKNKSIEGIWKSIGYGEILKIDSTTYEYFDITKISCLPAKQGNISEVKNSIVLKNDTLVVKRGYSFYYYTRTNYFPDLCQKNTNHTDDPLYNFEVFAETYKEHYAFFELNKINWDNLYKTAKEKINSKTTAVELYFIIQEMIESLNDNHGSIEPTDEVYEQAEQLNIENEDIEALNGYGDFQVAELVADYYLKENLTQNSWLINWGKMENNIGYIQIKSMFLYADLSLNESLVKENGFVPTYMDAFNKLSFEQQIEKEVAGIRNFMNTIIKDLKETKYIIIDVRFNGGGQDAVALEVLRHFNAERKHIASKKARHNDGFTKRTPIYLEPADNPYTKPVYLLTSQQSASATDMMALSSMELTHFKRIGSHTNGAISDALQKKLPNGWHFSLSNEIYTDKNDKYYENIGIPVDYELNYPEERQTFFRSVAEDLEKDKQSVLNAIRKLRNE